MITFSWCILYCLADFGLDFVILDSSFWVVRLFGVFLFILHFCSLGSRENEFMVYLEFCGFMLISVL